MIGPDGLRSGWSLALYVVLFALLATLSSWGQKSLSFAEPWSEGFKELGAFLAALVGR